MITIRQERPVDQSAREALLDAAYGEVRHAKPSARLRRGRLPADGLALVAVERGRILGSVRLWHVGAPRNAPALLLGPLAVHPDARRRGIGATLVRRALDEAKRLGHGAVLLVGDAAYYARFGFTTEKTSRLSLPGADPARLLALELVPGALDAAQGRLAASGQREPIPALAAFKSRSLPRAAARGAHLIPRAA
ncbi:MAG: GNAT family N-acetyltransferase [Pseudolabrys sp.]